MNCMQCQHQYWKGCSILCLHNIRKKAIRITKVAINALPSNWNALGSPPGPPTLRGTLPPPDIYLESLQGQLASHCQEDTEAEFLTAVTSHCMCHLMTNLHILSKLRYGFWCHLCLSTMTTTYEKDKYKYRYSCSPSERRWQSIRIYREALGTCAWFSHDS